MSDYDFVDDEDEVLLDDDDSISNNLNISGQDMMSTQELLDVSRCKEDKGRYVVLSPESVEVLINRYVRDLLKVIGIRLTAVRYGQQVADDMGANFPGNEELAEAILTAYHWEPDSVLQSWFDDSTKTLQAAGFDVKQFPGAPPSDLVEGSIMTCPILCIEVAAEEIARPPCGHMASKDAWQHYISLRLSEMNMVGITCMSCGDPLSYKFCVDTGELDEEQRSRLLSSRMVSFVQSDRMSRWCPGADCGRIIRFMDRLVEERKQKGTQTYTQGVSVTCTHCRSLFCFLCGTEAHRPIPCEVVAAWEQRNNAESDNAIWIFVHTKTCPECKNPIEKNMGCMHMTCKCGHEFCWLCLGTWKNHTTYYHSQCNVYDDKKQVANETPKNKAKQYLDRYFHFFDRYRSHNQGQRVAEEKMKEKIAELSSAQQAEAPILNLTHKLNEAVDQIIEGRRMLKFTYAFAYYARWQGDNVKALFEHQQGQLEWSLDRLQGLAESFDSKEPKDWSKYETDLAHLTKVVHEFFVNVCKVFEGEIIEVAAPTQLETDPPPAF